MYAHSNEVEEIGIITLTGVNVESDPHKETLLGVSVPVVRTCGANAQCNIVETIFVHSFHLI